MGKLFSPVEAVPFHIDTRYSLGHKASKEVNMALYLIGKDIYCRVDYSSSSFETVAQNEMHYSR